MKNQDVKTQDAREEPAAYRCPACEKTLNRISRKRWIKSYCEATGKTTRLRRSSLES